MVGEVRFEVVEDHWGVGGVDKDEALGLCTLDDVGVVVGEEGDCCDAVALEHLEH